VLNFVDLIFGVVILLAMARGWSRGLLSTIATYTAPVLGFMIAADMSDPVRDQLAVLVDAPDIALDLMAPLVLFIVVVAIVRFFAAILARLLGVGLSLPGRVLGAATSGAVLALLIGAAVLMIDEVSPLGSRAARETGTQPPAQGGDPLADLIVDVDRELGESVLAPRLASMATATWRRVSGKGDDEPLVPSQELESARDEAVDAVEREASQALQRNSINAAREAAGLAPIDDSAVNAKGDAAGKTSGDPAAKADNAKAPGDAAKEPGDAAKEPGDAGTRAQGNAAKAKDAAAAKPQATDPAR
jgi:uncharacterized membrane protein required for colicin V production